jgi:hypothetical protein
MCVWGGQSSQVLGAGSVPKFFGEIFLKITSNFVIFDAFWHVI